MNQKPTAQPVLLSPWHWNLWRAFLLIAWLQGAPALYTFIRAPVGTGITLSQGFSPLRLMVTILTLLLFLLFFLLSFESWVKKQQSKLRLEKALRFIRQASNGTVLLAIFTALFLFFAYALSLMPDIVEPYARGILSRLEPFILWFAGLSGQSSLALFATLAKDDLIRWRLNNKPFYLSLLAVATFMGIWAYVVHTSYGRESQITGWYEMGAPVLDTQVFLAWVASMCFAAFLGYLSTKHMKALNRVFSSPRRLDIAITFMLWLITVVVWWQTPLEPNWFVSEPRYPNFSYYPNSDARAYDTSAQTALIGEGYRFFKSDVVRRPLLALFFSLLHLVAGQTYKKVVFFQILVLALFPALVYLITAQLHHRLSGLLASLFILLREMNSIYLGSFITTSHAKLLMADLPSAVTVALFFLLVILWFKDLENNHTLALVSGGALGMAALIRPETLVFLFVVALFLFIRLLAQKAYRLWISHLLLFTLGIGLMLSPWIYRNWAKTGKVFLDSPTIFRLELLIIRYRPAEPLQTIEETTPAPESGAFPTPTPSTTRPETDLEGIVQSEMKNVIAYIRENSGEILSFIAAHYANSQLQTLLVLPTTFRGLEEFVSFLGHKSVPRLIEECCSLLSYIRELPYWRKWDGSFLSRSTLPLVFTSILIAWGISQTWKKYRITSIMPIVLSTSYLMLNALFRNSGGRYILPVDWVMVVYYSIGLMDLSVKGMHALFKRNCLYTITSLFVDVKEGKTAPAPSHRSKRYLVALGCLAVGAFVPVFETLIPPRYTQESAGQMLQALLASPVVSEEQRAQINLFLGQGGQIHAGRALYPRAYPANVGEPGTNNPFGPWPYPRLAFQLIGPFEEEFSLPITKKPPAFPHASDVLVFVCQGQEELLSVAIFDKTGKPLAYYTRSPWPENVACPLPSMLIPSEE